MIGDTWTTRQRAVVADALRAALDAQRVRLPPNTERRVVIELPGQLEAVGVAIAERR